MKFCENARATKREDGVRYHLAAGGQSRSKLRDSTGMVSDLKEGSCVPEGTDFPPRKCNKNPAKTLVTLADGEKEERGDDLRHGLLPLLARERVPGCGKGGLSL